MNPIYDNVNIYSEHVYVNKQWISVHDKILNEDMPWISCIPLSTITRLTASLTVASI